jgi:hypothetical protein
MRILVTGGRWFSNRDIVARTLAAQPGDAVLVHGAAKGADTLCASWWTAMGRNVDPHPADWSGPCRPTCRKGHRRRRSDGTSYCPSAGPYRNQEMLDSGVDLVIAFPGGDGTADMVRRATDAHVPVEQALP